MSLNNHLKHQANLLAILYKALENACPNFERTKHFL